MSNHYKYSIDRLIDRDIICKPFTHDRVIITRDGQDVLGLIGPVYSKYESGPSLFAVADVMGALLGPGYYGIASSRFLGFRA